MVLVDRLYESIFLRLAELTRFHDEHGQPEREPFVEATLSQEYPLPTDRLLDRKLFHGLCLSAWKLLLDEMRLRVEIFEGVLDCFPVGEARACGQLLPEPVDDLVLEEGMLLVRLPPQDLQDRQGDGAVRLLFLVLLIHVWRIDQGAMRVRFLPVHERNNGQVVDRTKGCIRSRAKRPPCPPLPSARPCRGGSSFRLQTCR